MLRGNERLGCLASAICAALFLAAIPASAASLSAIDSSTYTSILGAEVDSMSSSYDFSADGVDGTITSTVYEGTGAASGYFVYTSRSPSTVRRLLRSTP